MKLGLLHPIGALAAGLFAEGPGLAAACVIGHLDWPDARALMGQGGLSAAEQARAAAFRVDLARQTFVLGRSILRQGLALATGIPPAQIALSVEPMGRPVAPETGWHFSITHSGPWVAVAFCRGVIGCDLETGGNLRRTDLTGLARQVFCPQEIDRLAALADHPAEQRAFFLSVWRRKEAVLKAAGSGFSGNPRGFCVTTASGLADHVSHAGQIYAVTDLASPDLTGANLPVVSLARVLPDAGS